MATFQYKAIQPDGKVTQGELEANGRADAFRLMEGRRLRPISLSERVNGSGAKAAPAKKASVKPAARPAEKADKKTDQPETKPDKAAGAAPGLNLKLSFGGGKINARVLENFTRLLASLLAAGVPLSRALVILQKEAANPVAKEKWKEIYDLVVDGMTLADAMAKSPDVFPRVYVAMIEAGETGGFLDVVLGQIADFQAREKEMRGKVMTAMIYPAVLLVLAIGVLTFLLVFFVPRFQLIFASFPNAQLPALTQMIIGTSHILRSYGALVAIGGVIVVIMVRSWFVSEAGRRAWEGGILRLPMIGPLVAQFAMSRFCRMLGTLLAAGVPLINALNVGRRSIGNQILVDAVSNSIEQVKEGKALGLSLGECRTLFSGSTIEMISVAEESGRLDQELVRIANVTEGDLDRQLKTVVGLAEPALLFFIATFVGIIFIGMVLPIFTIQQYIK